MVFVFKYFQLNNMLTWYSKQAFNNIGGDYISNFTYLLRNSFKLPMYNIKHRVLTPMFFFFIFGFIHVSAFSQVKEDFSGQTFNSSGIWEGNIDQFIVNNKGQGQLNATGAGTSYISTPLVWKDSFAFSFYVKMNFAPSNNNKISMYLSGNQSDLNFSNGIMMNIGKTGDTDGVTLAVGDQMVSTIIAESGAGLFANGVDGTFSGLITEQRITIKFTNPDQTNWLVYDGPLPPGFILNSTSYFGFLMKYTSSNVKNFFIDDIFIDKYIPDTQGPVVTGVNAINLNSLQINLNEIVPEDELVDTLNYQIFNGLNDKIGIDSIKGNGLSAIIYTRSPLNNNPNRIIISGLHDKAGNLMESQELQFSLITYSSALLYDILINELLPDPTPVIGLPDGEFIELWNSSEKTLQLSQYRIQKTNVLYALPQRVFAPNEYIILVPGNEVAKWNSFPNVVGLASFPSLNNDGTSLSLIDSVGKEIHSMSYDLSSYKDNAKKDGGWSLEHTGKSGVCDGKNAYAASTDASGGTPGRENSNKSISPINLEVTGIEILDDYNVQLCFSKTLDFSTFVTTSSFHGLNVPEFNLFSPSPVASCCILEFEESLSDGIWYEIKLFNNFQNCLGTVLKLDTIIGFGKGFQKPAPGDVFVNEVLYNPATGGYDFVEFYNNTDKIFDLKGMTILNTQGNKSASITQTAFIQPKGYLAFCPSKAWLSANYKVKYPDNILEMAIPSFNSDMGNISLLDNQVVIDSFRYSEKMQNVFLSSTKGISLERVSWEQPANNNSNWQSASTDVGGGTPGYENSQKRVFAKTDKILVKTEEHFSPNQDGFLDQFIVTYHLDKPGYILRWRVFDAAGRLIKNNNSGILTGTDGFISWDGSTDNISKALPGIYVIEFQFTHDDGSTKRERISCVLSY